MSTWTQFSGLDFFLPLTNKDALIINGYVIHNLIKTKDIKHFLPIISLINCIKNISGMSFTTKEWHHGTKDGKPNTFHYLIAHINGAHFDLHINKLTKINELLELVDKSIDIEIFLSLQKALVNNKQIFWITEDLSILSCLEKTSLSNQLDKIKVCLPKKSKIDVSMYLKYLIKDASGNPIYLENLLEMINPKQSYRGILLSEVEESESLKKEDIKSILDLPKCMLGRQCTRYDNLIHCNQFRHPCKDFQRCIYITDINYGTSQERGVHFEKYGHLCSYSIKCTKKTSKHWKTHEHITYKSEIEKCLRGIRCPFLNKRSTEAEEHLKQFTHPCKFGKKCVCYDDREWNHEHFLYYTHN
jgi:hypothetical protein